MKEVIYVHIARIQFAIERDAQRALQKYLDDIGAVMDGPHRHDILQEIEARMVEILASRGIHTQGTITDKDVEALKTQLGEPRDFVDEEREDEPAAKDSAPGSADKVHEFLKRKFYRDEERGLIAGVCYGIAKNIDIDPIWVRLLFVVLTVLTHGFGILLYIVLAILMPNVKNDADRLRMEGKPVNIKSLQHLKNERARLTASAGRRAWGAFWSIMYKLFKVAVAVLLVALSVGAVVPLLIGLALVSGLFGGMDRDLFGVSIVQGHWYVQAALIAVLVAMASALLLLAIGVKTVVFGGQINRRITIGLAVLFGLSLLGGAILAYPTGRQVARVVQEKQQPSVYKFDQPITAVDLETASFVTVQQGGPQRVEVSQPIVRSRKMLNLSQKNGTLYIRDNEQDCHWLCADNYPSITIYVPSLKDVKAKEIGGWLELRGNMDKVTFTGASPVIGAGAGSLNIRGTVHNLSATLYDGNNITTGDAVIDNAVLDYKGVHAVTAFGVVGSVSVKYPASNTACSANQSWPEYNVAYSSVKSVRLNGKDITAQLGNLKPIDQSNQMDICLKLAHQTL